MTYSSPARYKRSVSSCRSETESTAMFSEKMLDDLAEARARVKRQYYNLLTTFVERPFRNATAKEYATHGFPRRVKMLVRCVHRVFDLLPPESKEIPSDDARTDATVYIQAFVFNVFGAIDNLAWIWVQERDVRRPDGRPLSKS